MSVVSQFVPNLLEHGGMHDSDIDIGLGAEFPIAGKRCAVSQLPF
jgi:hypothetical protein